MSVHCFTRNGYDWADRFPAIVDTALGVNAHSFLNDGEVVVPRQDGTSDFHSLRSKQRGQEAVLFAFDLIELNDNDLRDMLFRSGIGALLRWQTTRACAGSMNQNPDFEKQVRACMSPSVRRHALLTRGVLQTPHARARNSTSE
jgi:hypothetical protein